VVPQGRLPGEKSSRGYLRCFAKVCSSYFLGSFWAHVPAITHFSMSAFTHSQGVADAQFNLGNLFSRGRGVKRSDGDAVKW